LEASRACETPHACETYIDLQASVLRAHPPLVPRWPACWRSPGSGSSVGLGLCFSPSRLCWGSWHSSRTSAEVVTAWASRPNGTRRLRLMRPDELERRLRERLEALGPAPRAEEALVSTSTQRTQRPKKSIPPLGTGNQRRTASRLSRPGPRAGSGYPRSWPLNPVGGAESSGSEAPFQDGQRPRLRLSRRPGRVRRQRTRQSVP
jgi:hypothetical protein